MKSLLHHHRVLHRQRLIEAEVLAHGLKRLRRGVAAGDAGGGIGAGRGEEDQEHQHADAEHHEQHLAERRIEGAAASGASRCAASSAGSSASRKPSPRTLSVEHREHDGDARRQRHHRPRVEQALAVLDDGAPACIGRLHADRQERQRRLGQHVDRHHAAARRRSASSSRWAGCRATGCDAPARRGRWRPARTRFRVSDSTWPRIGRAT